MPFITQERRKIIEEGVGTWKVQSWWQPGDRCYVFYKKMVEQWKANPRWTTAHEIYKEVLFEPWTENRDDSTAKELAWQVFFQLYVIPYELKKREDNGDI